MTEHKVAGRESGWPSCSAMADGFNGSVVHMANHDLMLGAVSRAPLEKLQAYKQRMEWTFPWASPFASDIDYDFGISHTEEQLQSGATEDNFATIDMRPMPAWHRCHLGMYPWLDRAPRGRNETGPWWRRHDEY